MARLDTYKKDLEINGLDYLAGSSYVTTGINGPVYETTKFSMLDLARFFGSYTNINGFTYDIAQMYEDIQNNITSLAAVSINITALADATQALAQIDIDLQTAFSNGISAAVSEINLTLTSLSNADLALASVVTNLETSFTTQLTEAVATINTELVTLTTADSALATSITELETTFTTDLTAAVATINTELTTLSTADAALATSITELETTFTTDIATAVATINTELTTLSTADAALATSITELETTFTTDLTAAVATINTELTTLSTADAALATSITELETSFATDLTNAVATINTELTTLSTADQALATSITTLETNFNTDIAATNAAITQEATTRANAIEAEATARQALETSFTTALGETNAAIVAEASTRSTADLAEATAREALATSIATDIATVTAAVTAETLARTTEDEALATSITTLETNFNTELSTTNAAIVTEATARADADAAEATARETLAASIATDIATVTAAVTTEQNARTTADEAIAEDITALETAISNETTARTAAITTVNQAIVDEASARTSADTTLTSAISVKPNVYRQASAPAVTEPVGSVWYDTDDNNKTYVLAAGTPNVWTITDDSRIGATITSLATAQESLNTLSTDLQSEATKITKLQAQYTFDANGDVDGLASGTIVSNAVNNAYSSAVADAESATATAITSLSATISKVYRQDAEPTDTIPTNSIWYDTNDGNKSYVYNGTSWVYTVDATLATTASVDTVQSAVNDINGNLNAQYGLKVSAGGAIAGMTLSASATDAEATSSVVFQADQFNIKTDSGTKTPFSVSGDVVTMSNVVVAGTVSIGGTAASTLVSNASIAATAIQPSDNISELTNDAGFQNATQVNESDKTDGTVAGWSIDSNYIWSGTKQTTNTYSVDGITMFNGGAIRTPQFYIDHTNGNAFFKGTLSAASGTFAGALSAATGTFAGDLSAATGTFAGELSAASGTFTGELSAATGTFEGSLSAGNIKINSYDTPSIDMETDAGDLTSRSINFRNADGTVGASLYAQYASAGGTVGEINMSLISTGITTIQSGTDAGDQIRLKGPVYYYPSSGSASNYLLDFASNMSTGDATSGYQRLSNGLLMCWVKGTTGSTGVVASGSWPQAFSLIYGAVVSKSRQSTSPDTGSNDINVGWSTSRYYVRVNDATREFFIIAIGRHA